MRDKPVKPPMINHGPLAKGGNSPTEPMNTDPLEKFEAAVEASLLHNYYSEAMDALDDSTKEFVENTSWAAELHRAAELKLEVAAIRQAAIELANERVSGVLDGMAKSAESLLSLYVSEGDKEYIIEQLFGVVASKEGE